MKDFKSFSSRCFRDVPPPCVSVCPLQVDVREMIVKMQRGNFAAAYRTYRNQVLFPGIVSAICSEPCRAVCVRNNHDESIYIRKLEAACVSLTQDKTPIQFNVPPKPFTVAVIGAGLSGLSCALKLASKNYRVRLYARSGRLGGALWKFLPEEAFLEELERQLGSVEYEPRLSEAVIDLDDVEADAIYVATGTGGENFGLQALENASSLGSSRKGVFLGGGLMHQDPIWAIENGARASLSIEKFLKVGAMDGVTEMRRQEVDTRYYALPVTPVLSSLDKDETLPKESVVAESRRCLRCNCGICHDNCEMMQRFHAYPEKIVTNIVSSLNVIEGMTERVAQRLVNSCTQCGLCANICPERVDMENCILNARRALHSDGSLPKAFHDFWLRDMEHAEGDARLLHLPQGKRECSLLFFPGCRLGTSDPEYILKTYSYLCEKRADTALLLSCCGVPADWAGDEKRRDAVLDALRRDWERIGRPHLVLACPTCKKTLGKYFPGAECISLYELLEPCAPDRISAESTNTVSIFDPCSSRDDMAMQRSVRVLAKKAGMRITEDDESGKNALCCGLGGHIYAANPDLVNDIVSKRIAGGAAEFITYCTNCRDIFSLAGKPCRHILDVLFTGNSARRLPPSLSQRRRNRMLLKGHFSGNAITQENETEMKLVISPELAEKMDRLLILEEEARGAIRHCEETQMKILNPETGHYTGHLQIGIITYWVTYAVEKDAFVLHNVYSHRMNIVG